MGSYSLSDAVNLAWCAAGSVQLARLTADSNYNGHYITVAYNDYRKYWTCEYYWGQRLVLSRGSLKDALQAGYAEYLRGARGTQVVTNDLDPDEAPIASAIGYVKYKGINDPQPRPEWMDARYDEVATALWYEKHMGIPAAQYLVNSATVEEFKALVNAGLKERQNTIICAPWEP